MPRTRPLLGIVSGVRTGLFKEEERYESPVP